jgi:glyoxylase-like metal-dependent hydrolase (beta-lactamase superfamily II)/ferredoxin
VARPELRLAENVPGPFYVDETCIDCDACRQLAPGVFSRSARGLSFVARQPDAPDRGSAVIALAACPTASIGGAKGAEVRAAIASLPLPVDGPVFDLVLRSESSFGATSYLVAREDGNVIVDSPRAAEPLLRRIDALGGARWNFLTHRDDVADHAQLHERFGCERILHRADVSAGTRSVERQLEGDSPVDLARGLVAIPVPGHTRGSCALLVDDTYLFTGDHLWADDEETIPNGRGDAIRMVSPSRLDMSRSVCWWSWGTQVESLRKLLDFSFTWVLPGHGRPFHAGSREEMRGAIRDLLARVR